MKILSLLLLFVIGSLHSLANQADRVRDISKALHSSKVPELVLEKSTFEDALALVRAEWNRQHPTLDFPVALAEYERDRGHPDLITVSLRDVLFIDALRSLGVVANRRLTEKSELLTFSDYGLIVEHWITKSYRVTESLLRKLKLGRNPTGEELVAAYRRYGVILEDWMSISHQADEGLIVTALEKQQDQIAGINHLLAQGFTIHKADPAQE
ncbi:hypothetical protein [Sulfuriroseicoccus oceanibius]|uniref:Uncharacterized protein n=1 Tax=Sulfuriroseicoccus oceanibius TaxID=2707525 RepID=A0A6B3LBI7_9BACT|nr:hypothetical protein [Sulfuriroseicoccus oceanibius]QQL44096.1 hypothetical protein G3M56_009335 [Sulfuriroseicoccus oceanibius]